MRTVDQVSELIKKRYDEYIIDPQVSSKLDKASSYRYSIIGDIGQPGVKLMSHRMTVTEAINEAGGVLETGDKSKVVVLRKQQNGNLAPIAVNVSKISRARLLIRCILFLVIKFLYLGTSLRPSKKS